MFSLFFFFFVFFCFVGPNESAIVIDCFAQYFLEAYLMIHGETESYEEFMMGFFSLSLSVRERVWVCFVIVVLFCLLFQVIEFPHQ